MGLKTLAEGIIMQSLEDLWDEGLSESSVAFFRGESFNICADMAEMDIAGRLKLLNMVKEIIEKGGVKKRVDPGAMPAHISRPARERIFSQW
jgi:hypothetical protein